MFWANVTFLGIVTVPVAWVLFCQEYTNRGYIITRRYVLFLLVEPAFILLLLSGQMNSIIYFARRSFWTQRDPLWL
ncbi:MAG: hypothetical protein IPL78_36275 [Chloroflexi bacterium]|nr:hypothetical protein [Chloroflexota bacterium]